MKQFFKATLFSMLLSLSLNAKAQSIITPAADSATYQSGLRMTFWSINMLLLSDKFANYADSSVVYNSQSIQWTLFQEPPHCGYGKVCTEMAIAPQKIILPVIKVAAEGCYDVYYAATPENVKAEVFEQIVLQKYNSDRCKPLVVVDLGKLFYHISGISKITGQVITARARLDVISIQKLK